MTNNNDIQEQDDFRSKFSPTSKVLDNIEEGLKERKSKVEKIEFLDSMLRFYENTYLYAEKWREKGIIMNDSDFDRIAIEQIKRKRDFVLNFEKEPEKHKNKLPESSRLNENAKAVSLLVNCLYINNYLNDIVPNRVYFDSIAQNYGLENGETIYQNYTAITSGNAHRTPLKRKHIELVIQILENDSRYPKALRTINMYLESIEPNQFKK